MNDEISVMKLNGESLRAKEEDLRPVGLGFKRSHYLSKCYGVYASDVDSVSLKAIVLSFMKVDIMTGDENVVNETLKTAKQLEVIEELEAFMRDF